MRLKTLVYIFIGQTGIFCTKIKNRFHICNGFVLLADNKVVHYAKHCYAASAATNFVSSQGCRISVVLILGSLLHLNESIDNMAYSLQVRAVTSDTRKLAGETFSPGGRGEEKD